MPVPGDEEITPTSPVIKWAGQPAQANGLNASQVSATAASTHPYDPTKKPSPFAEIGASGLAQYGGFVRDEFLPALQGDNARKVYREMYDNDPIVNGIVFAIQMLLRSVPWRVEPPEAATVEEIVQERFEERQQAVREQQMGQQQRLMEAQAGMAGNAQGGSKRGLGPDGKPTGGQAIAPAGPPPRSGLAGGASTPTGIHQPLSGSPTAPGSAGPNSRDGSTMPGSNSPAQPDVEGTDARSNPGTNPGGGPAQAAALEGNFGLGTESKPDDTQRRLSALSKSLRRLFGSERFAKAAGGGGGGSSGGGGGGGIIDGAIGMQPIDPETGQPMEFPVGAGLQDLTPEARHAEELAVFVETCLHDMADSWADTLSSIVTMIVFGFSYHELIYKKRNGPNPDFPSQGSKFADGRVGWANFSGRAQETLFRWEFDDHSNIIGFWQLSPPKFELRYIPLSKALLFRTTAWKNNPEGRSIFRGAYRPWFMKKRIEEYEAIGIERDLAGLPIAKVPYTLMTAGATPDEKATLEEVKTIVRNVRANEQAGIVWPVAFDPDHGGELWGFELLSAGGTSKSFDTDKVITRYEQRMAMTALCDVLMLGHDSVGARSLGETKVDLLTSALEGWLDSIADVVNVSAIPKLMQINGEDPAMCPRLTHGKMATVGLDQIAALITALSGAGADLFPDTILEDWVREEGGMPPKAASQDL